MIVNKKIISLNIFFSLFQIVVTGLAYYFLYKFLLKELGPDLMGVWAVVLSISSTANIANLGIGSSVVRFTAKFRAANDTVRINKLLHTSLIFLAVIFIAVISVVYLIAPFWLHAVIDDRYYPAAMSLLPFSLLCLFFNALNGIFASCIDGLQKNFLRSIIFVGSFIVLLVFSFYWVPKYGLLGVAYAQLLQSVFLIIGMLTSLKFVFPAVRIFSFGWDRYIYKQIFSFGIKEQIISICQLCFDPLTKSLLSNYGSLELVTYYEMANRLVLQVRGLLVSANQVLLPVFTNAHEHASETSKQLYRQIFSMNFLMTAIWFAVIVGGVIPISKIWIGEVNQPFVIITIILAAAYFFNILMSPAYYANMGSAQLNDNVLGNVIIAVFNLLLCYGFGSIFGGFGVVAGWSIALMAGSLYVIATYHKKWSLLLNVVVLPKDWIVVFLCLVFGVFSILFFIYNPELKVGLMFLAYFIFLAILLLIVSRIHPVWSKLLNIVLKRTT